MQPEFCQAPYVHGVGGWCGCDCKCCPPCACNTMCAVFQAGADPATGSEIPCGCTYPTTSPDIFYLQTRNISNACCTSCFYDYNGHFTLHRTPGTCEWTSMEQAKCPTTNAMVPRWRLVRIPSMSCPPPGSGIWYIEMLGTPGAFIAQWGIFDQKMQADTWTTNVVVDSPPGEPLPYFAANPFNNSIGICDTSKAYISVKADCRCTATNDAPPASPSLNLYGLQTPINPLPVSAQLHRALSQSKYDENIPFGLDDISPYKMGDEVSPLSVKLIEDTYKPKYNIDIPLPVPAMPKFNRKPIVSKDGQFGYYGANACSIPCEQIKVCLTGSLCCFEFKNNEVYAVGNGTVYATISGASKGECGYYYPYLTRWGEGANAPEPWHKSPINVCDGDLIMVDLIATNEPLNPVPEGLPTFDKINPCCYPTCFVYWINPCLKSYRLQSRMGRPTIIVNPDAIRKKMENIRSQKAFKLRQIGRFKKG